VELKRARGETLHAPSLHVEDSLDELERLAETAGLQVVGRAVQHVERINPATLIGKGKLQQIIDSRAETSFDVLIFDEELAPNQQREIEQAFGGEDIKVLDRTALILDIFAQHARTKEGALQVELAQYEYRLPRLTRMWTHLARQAGGAAGRGGTGGVGLRGPGERQLELDRREIRTRITHLKKQIELVRMQRREHRRKRQREGMPVVAIVGYTNAGKSTLLNALTNAGVLVEDKLFATLDPTTRRVKLPGGSEALFTDTVGFIQKLPTQLVAAFRATLEEITEADVLLHIIDATHPNMLDQARAVDATLEEIGAGDKPVVIALNKMDKAKGMVQKTGNDVRTPHAPRQFAITQDELLAHGVRISALKGQGLDELLVRIEQALADEMVELRVRIPFSRNDLVALFHERGIIEREKFLEDGTLIEGRIAARLVERFEDYQI
jgi:GTP-binding protein HflX